MARGGAPSDPPDVSQAISQACTLTSVSAQLLTCWHSSLRDGKDLTWLTSKGSAGNPPATL